MMTFFLPQLLTLTAEATTIEPSTWVVHEEGKFKDAFSNLTLDRVPFNFPTLTEKERQLMETIIGGRSTLERLVLRW
jgi:hypothetical protein